MGLAICDLFAVWSRSWDDCFWSRRRHARGLSCPVNQRFCRVWVVRCGCDMIVRLLCRRGSCHRGIDREAGPTDQTNREVTCGTDEEES